jgi:hypothetical protein
MTDASLAETLMWSQTWIWQHAWHVLIVAGGFAGWLLIRILSDAIGFYWQDKGYLDQEAAKMRGRDRILESFDRDHPE